MVAYSWSYDIWFLLTSFQKSNKGWPLAEKVLKLNMIFHDHTKKMFSKHQNKAGFKTLGDSDLLSGDFSGLKTYAVSLTSSASAASLASITSTAFFHQRTS